MTGLQKKEERFRKYFHNWSLIAKSKQKFWPKYYTSKRQEKNLKTSSLHIKTDLISRSSKYSFLETVPYKRRSATTCQNLRIPWFID
jgi:hypothetical protein